MVTAGRSSSSVVPLTSSGGSGSAGGGVASLTARLSELGARILEEHEREVSCLHDVVTKLQEQIEEGGTLIGKQESLGTNSIITLKADGDVGSLQASLRKQHLQQQQAQTLAQTLVPVDDPAASSDGPRPRGRTVSFIEAGSDSLSGADLHDVPELEDDQQDEASVGSRRAPFVAGMSSITSKASSRVVGKARSRSMTDWPPKVRPELRHLPSGGSAMMRHTVRNTFVQNNPVSTERADLIRARTDFSRFTTSVNAASQLLSSISGSLPTRRCFIMRYLNLPLHPNAHSRTLLDTCFLIVMLYDSVAIPYHLAFNVQLKGSVLVIAWLTLSFWTLDLVLGFATGYFPSGAHSGAIMSFRKIAVRYLTTWFLPDLIIVIFDWVSVLFDSGSDSLQLRMIRMARLGRVFRVLEVISMGRYDLMFQKFGSLLDTTTWSDVIQLTVTVAKQSFIICWINHCGCCLWYVIGTVGRSTATSTSWLDEAEHNAISEANTPSYDFEMYIRGYIWSTTTMLGESPQWGMNLPELSFQAFWLVVGLVFGSLIVSSLADMMWQLQEMKKEQTAKRVALRRFLSQQKVDRGLSFAIQREVAARLSRRKRLGEQDVPSLALISPGLRMQLRHSRCEDFLHKHPLLHTFAGLHRSFIRGLCARAVSYDFHKPGKEVFKVNDHAEACYYVAWGSLQYFLPSSFECNTEDEDIMDGSAMMEVKKDRWLSEQALFFHWTHQGSIEAVDSAELVTVSWKGFNQQVSHMPDLHALVLSYAESLARSLTDFLPEVITDVYLGADHGLVVLGMSVAPRIRMAEPGLEVLRSEQWWSSMLRGSKSLQELEDEVAAGQCTLVQDVAGHVMRLCSLVAVRVERHDGRLLAQVAKWDSEEKVVTDMHCTLPGKKTKPNERISDTLSRVMSDGLEPLEVHLRYGQQEVLHEERDSVQFSGLRTLYVRTVNHARVMPSFDAAADVVSQNLQPMRKTLRDRLNNTKIATSSQAWGWETTGLNWPPEAFVFRRKGGSAEERKTRPVLMWLSALEFQELSDSTKGKEIIKDWMQDLDFTEPPAEARQSGGSLDPMQSMQSAETAYKTLNSMSPHASEGPLDHEAAAAQTSSKTDGVVPTTF